MQSETTSGTQNKALEIHAHIPLRHRSSAANEQEKQAVVTVTFRAVSKRFYPNLTHDVQ